METKRCYRCKEEKPLSAFGKDRRAKDGLNGCCRECKKLYNAAQKEYLKEYMKTYRQNYKKSPERREHERQYARQYRKEHPENCKKTFARYRAAINNCPGEISENEIKMCLEFFAHECAYTGVPLTTGYHLDHVIPISKGGSNTIHNCVPCLGVVNLQKSAKDFEEWYLKQSFFSEKRYNRIKEWLSKREE